ncbi:PREDICTED: uncharacterized protein C7orf61 homolog [Condylura cristata]|uniref:uncharacterized protein C7orf61 homolog n=1 Tax=Condylura cristata TaxID=143302 RepID=UPI0003347299|nr:PREDICTED: uncharacterized protein C7orf61 homolog [Condylura cristata]
MAVVMRFFRWIWRKFTCWVSFWKHKAKPAISESPDPKKTVLKGVEKTPKLVETFKLVEAPKEAKFLTMDESPTETDPCMLATTTDGAGEELDQGGRSLLQLPRSAVKSVSTLMVSVLQSGWQMCSWKPSVSSTSVASQMRTGSPLESPEAEMLREVYLVLWAIRKQLRQLARRQERRRRRHIRAHTCTQPDSVKTLKEDTRSPL